MRGARVGYCGGVDKDVYGVPAGWYPDPLGLPQLRWWDAQAWTEHTSEARAPIVIQPAAESTVDGIAAEQPLPSRRQLREQEREETTDTVVPDTLTPDEEQDARDRTGADELSAQQLLEMTLRELKPPSTDTVDEATPGPRRASFHASASAVASTLPELTEDVPPAAPKLRTYTVAVWAIAFMPALQFGLSIVLLAVLGLGGNVQLMVAVMVAPYFIVIGLAFYDRLVLQVWGHSRPATAFWAVLSAPVYLLARARRTHRETGKGWPPLIIWCVAMMAAASSVVVWPGLVISLAPVQFAHEVEQSVTADAVILGAELDVDCPTPALLIGETFTCRAEKPTGATDSIVVGLERENGWITWRVKNWGDWVLAY